MSKQNNHVLNDRTNIVVKAVLISLYRIGSIYGPALDNLARQYVELKKEKKATNQKQNKIEYSKKQQEIIIEAQKIISPMERITEIVPFQAKEQWILDILKAGEELLNKENEIRIKRFAKKAKKIENTPQTKPDKF